MAKSILMAKSIVLYENQICQNQFYTFKITFVLFLPTEIKHTLNLINCNSEGQLSIVGCPVCSILLIMSIPNAESDELVKNSRLLTYQLQQN